MGQLRNQHLNALNFNDNSEPSTEEITKAYRQLARQYHPDKTKGDKAAEEKFKAIANAHEFLKKTRFQQDCLERKFETENGSSHSYSSASGHGPTPFRGGEPFNFSNYVDEIMRVMREKERQEREERLRQMRRQEAEERERQRREAEERARREAEEEQERLRQEERERKEQERSNRLINFRSVFKRSYLPPPLTTFLSFVAVALITYLCAANLLSALSLALFVSIPVYFIAKRHQENLIKAYTKYANPRKIAKLNDTLSKQALKAGIEANTWSGYLPTFWNKATYLRKTEYEVGVIFAKAKDEATINEVKNLKI